MWGVNSNNQLHRRIGITTSNQFGTHWEHLTGKTFKHVSVGCSGVWAIDLSYDIWYLNGSNIDEYIPLTEFQWINVPGGLMVTDVAFYGKSV